MWFARSACQYWGWSSQSSLYYPFARYTAVPEARRFHTICLPAMNVRNNYCIQLCLLPHTVNTGHCMAISGVLETFVSITFQYLSVNFWLSIQNLAALQSRQLSAGCPDSWLWLGLTSWLAEIRDIIAKVMADCNIEQTMTNFEKTMAKEDARWD